MGAVREQAVRELADGVDPCPPRRLTFIRQRLWGMGFGLQCGGQHPSCPLPGDQSIRKERLAARPSVVDHAEQERAFQAGAANTGLAR